MSATPARSYTRIAIAVVVAAVVIGAGIVASMYLAATATSTGTVTVGPSLARLCNEQVWSAGSSQSNGEVPVLLMQPLSTAYVCVTYQSEWQGSANQYHSEYTSGGTDQLGLYMSPGHCMMVAVGSNGESVSCAAGAPNPFMTSGPFSFQPSAATDYVTVVFTVSSLGNSTGFYDYAPSNSCGSMPMAVGYTASQLNASDFGPRVQPQGCMPLALEPSSVSVGGMSVAHVALEGAFDL